jgi:hypothetical protein
LRRFWFFGDNLTINLRKAKLYYGVGVSSVGAINSVSVGEGVSVGVCVSEGVAVAVCVRVNVGVMVGVSDGVGVGVRVTAGKSIEPKLPNPSNSRKIQPPAYCSNDGSG